MTDTAVPLPDPSRRAFCTYGCLSTAAVALSALAAGCGGEGGTSATSPGGSGSTGSALPAANATISGRTVAVVVDGSPLATVGSAALLRTSLGNFLVVRTGQDAFTALTATCTHEGNLITNFTGSQFACPVHGSMFNTTGTVARGPATRALATYPTMFANGVVSFPV
jgi:cytochrome b6-f complex iron-sulfur subunit